MFSGCARKQYKINDTFKVTNGSFKIANIQFKVNYSNGEISGDFKDSYPLDIKFHKQTDERSYKISGELDRVKDTVKIYIRGTIVSENLTNSGDYTLTWEVTSVIKGQLDNQGIIKGSETTDYRIIKPPKSKFVYKYGNYYITRLISFTPNNFSGISENNNFKAEPVEKQ